MNNKKEQKIDKYGDSINCYTTNFNDFKNQWMKRFTTNDINVIKEFYDDFKHNDNQTTQSYFEEITNDFR